MAHPLVAQVLEIASPIAASLNLEVVGAVFQTNQSPPVLRVDIRNPDGDTGLNDCEQMSRALEAALDESSWVPDAYVLEISSPGVPKTLTTDREFTSFRGFPVLVRTTEAVGNRKEVLGNLIRRDEEHVYLNQKGRSLKIARAIIDTVQLVDGPE